MTKLDPIVEVYKEIGDALYASTERAEISLICAQGDIIVYMNTSGDKEYTLNLTQRDNSIRLDPYEDVGEARRLAGLLLSWADKLEPRANNGEKNNV